MDRVYLLLRNNQQTGPFTIDELLQQQVKPSDMIWIEGRSSAWTYLSELELTPHIQKAEAVHKRPTKMNDEIEVKAEELRQRILASAPKALSPYPTEIETYASPYRSSENQIEFVDIKKERRIKKNTALIEFILTFFVAGLFMLGIYKGKSFLGAKDKVQNSVATELNSRDQHAAQKSKVVSRPAVVVIDTVKQADSLLSIQKAKPKLVKKVVADSTITHPVPSINSLKTEEKASETTTQASASDGDDTLKKNALLKKEINPSVLEIKNSDEPIKEEKKGFLKGIFKKKKKDDKD